MDNEDKNTQFSSLEGDPDYDSQELNAAALQLTLKSVLYSIKHSQHEPSPLENKGHEFVRKLVAINKEVEAKEKGEQHNDLIADNAPTMAAAFGNKWLEETKDLRAEDVPTASPYNSMEVSAASSPPPSERITTTPITTVQTVTAAHPQKAQKSLPAFKQDRRTVQRTASDKPLFSELAEEYLALRESKSNTANKDIKIARVRIDLFIDLIGDHPVDTYTGTDLQAYVELMKYWPANAKDRDANKTPREIIASNRDMRLLPLAHKTLVQGYVAIVKTVIISGQNNYNYPNPIARSPRPHKPCWPIHHLSRSLL